jgi:hypothetical protein
LVPIGALASLATMALPASASYQAPTGPELPPERIEQLASTRAQAAGEGEPVTMELVHTTFAEANAWMSPHGGGPIGSTPESQEWLRSTVYLVLMRGAFYWTGPIPQRAKVPRATTLTLIFDAHTGFDEVTGLGNAPPDLSRLGPVTSLVASADGIDAFPLNDGQVQGTVRHHRKPAAGLQVVVRQSQTIVATRTTLAAGGFYLRLPAGTYLLNARTPRGGRCGSRTVILGALQEVRPEINC